MNQQGRHSGYRSFSLSPSLKDPTEPEDLRSAHCLENVVCVALWEEQGLQIPG